MPTSRALRQLHDGSTRGVLKWTHGADPQRCRCVHTRVPALEADKSLGSGRVARVLEQLIAKRGLPESVRSDNGPEFCSRRMLAWAEERKVELVHVQPG